MEQLGGLTISDNIELFQRIHGLNSEEKEIADKIKQLRKREREIREERQGLEAELRKSTNTRVAAEIKGVVA